jgi:hypothetical protein
MDLLLFFLLFLAQECGLDLGFFFLVDHCQWQEGAVMLGPAPSRGLQGGG